ncbi:MAG TPA: TetR/AcrR family transcriptional regulator [Actinomycetospora sp.]|uniref:TetR/AcrR family transcriptional regulator n=1 Tax=Actinomycetospora sp. TaxID=1872135 RepID=UPI002F4237AD
MENKRRTQAERSAATSAALKAAARRLWAERGFAEVGTPEIATAAGVTRGAMYHQFADKNALFVAVLDDIEREVMARLVDAVERAAPDSPATALRVAADEWLEVCLDPEVHRLVLLDAPSVLGWSRFRDLTRQYSLGLTEALLGEAIDAGQLAPQPTRPLAHILIGALDEGALVIATATDRDRASGEVHDVLHRLVDALVGPPRSQG